MSAMSVHQQPSTLDEAVALLSREAGACRVIAGATDVYPADVVKEAWLQTHAARRTVDIGNVDGLRGISICGGEVAFGALATWTEIAEARLPPGFAALQAAALQVGGRQIQNRGTIGGNLCNASPAADGAPPLLALDAEVELASAAGLRRLPLAAFILGNRRTALAPDELLTRIVVRAPPDDERSAFLKLGARSYLVISIASVAANVRFGPDGRIASARIALGACSAAPIRLGRIEREAVGRLPSAIDVSLGSDDGVAPIGDVRASADYRRAAAGILVRRALAACAEAPAGGA
jgi:N-methylhydantoinase B